MVSFSKGPRGAKASFDMNNQDSSTGLHQQAIERAAYNGNDIFSSMAQSNDNGLAVHTYDNNDHTAMTMDGVRQKTYCFGRTMAPHQELQHFNQEAQRSEFERNGRMVLGGGMMQAQSSNAVMHVNSNYIEMRDIPVPSIEENKQDDEFHARVDRARRARETYPSIASTSTVVNDQNDELQPAADNAGAIFSPTFPFTIVDYRRDGIPPEAMHAHLFDQTLLQNFKIYHSKYGFIRPLRLDAFILSNRKHYDPDLGVMIWPLRHPQLDHHYLGEPFHGLFFDPRQRVWTADYSRIPISIISTDSDTSDGFPELRPCEWDSERGVWTREFRYANSEDPSFRGFLFNPLIGLWTQDLGQPSLGLC